uniref:Uncharacterized protein n=1 Tax=Romanomermis culicivorax TaxID=13658 RepID=A0A915IBH8_ROMCU
MGKKKKYKAKNDPQLFYNTDTSDGHFSPLSFGSAAPKPHSNESTKLKDVAFMESWWSVFGLSRDTLAVLIGFITILIIILTIISSIALSVTKRQLKKRGLKNSKKKFSDTSKKIHYEYSFVRSKKKLGNEVATFYAAHVPEYDSLNNLDNINHSENENGGPKDQNTKLLSSSSYSPSNNNEQQKQNYANLYSNPLNDLDHAIVDRQTLPSIYGDISDDYMMHDVIEAPAYVAKAFIGVDCRAIAKFFAIDSLLCKSVVEAIASDRASSVASFHSADRNSNFLSAASHNNSYLKSPAILTTRFLTLTTNSSGNNNNPYDFSSNRIYSPHQQQTIATLNQQRAGTLQPKSHFNRTSANNSLSSSSRKHFRSPSPRLPLPVPTPELRSLHYDCLLRSNLNTPSPSKDAQKFDYDSQYSPSQYFKNNCIYDSNIGNTYHSPKIFQNLADSPRSSSSTFRQLKGESGGDGGSPVSTSSKNFGSTFKPPRGDSCVSRNSNNSGILNSYAQIINNSTNQKLTNKTIVAGDDRELESMALYDWSEHILNTSGFGSKGQSEVR